jgi:hypothetical protein
MNGLDKVNTETGLKQVQNRQLSTAGLNAFFNIVHLWGIDLQQALVLLGEPSREIYESWKKNPEAAQLSRDTLERISYLLGIYKALQILLPEASIADEWIKKPNDAANFAGKSALDIMLLGNVSDLYLVRQYLDGLCLE